MKTLLLIYFPFLLLQSNSVAQQGWEDVTPPGTYPGLNGVYALNSEHIWVVGDEGTILKTTDGGITWGEINCPVTYPLYNVHFVNEDTGWVGGDNNSITEIMRTTNGGLSWELKTLMGSSDYGNYDIEFIEGSPGEPPRGFVSAGLSLVWKTDDFGENWVDIGFGTCGANSLRSISFINKNEGWFVGEPSATQEVSIVRTTDGGQTYEIQTNPINPDIRLNCVSFADNQHGIAAGVGSTILYTSNGGNDWESRPVSNYRWQSVHLIGSGKAWAVGRNGTIMCSTDWGYTWSAQASGVVCELWEVFFTNDDEGWVVGGGAGYPGVILRTKNGGVSLVEEKQTDEMPTEFLLSQNWPNPFNPSTKIKYSVPQTSQVQITVFDVLGNEIETLVNEEKSAGAYEITWNAVNLPSGIYFYKLIAGSFNRVMKMIVLK